MGNVRPIPEGYHTLTPYLYVKDAAKAIDFYTRAFGAKETVRMPGPNGTIGHAEVKIGSSMLMLADEDPERGIRSPKALGGVPFNMVLYMEDVDTVFERAVSAGATVMRPIKDEWYGERVGTVVDPFGFEWSLMMHVEDVSPEEMGRRAAEQAKSAERQEQAASA